ncbi:glutaredoxin family protein [Candidatus Saccharibacteria bacterium]|nr:glutaredoxin family protein [Candidatus Saccharibacteria bacterium]
MAKDKPTVTIYGTSWCGYCHAEANWLKQQNVDFTYKDIEADPQAKQELLTRLGGVFQGVPVTVIGNDVILGFDRPNLMDSLKTYELHK